MNTATATLELIEQPPTESRQIRTAVSTTPADLLRIAVETGAALDRMERLMALQERWEANEARKAFVVAMAAFKAEPMTIFKKKGVGYTTRDGDFVGYKHAELSDVTEVVCPAMSKHGLSHRWDVVQEGKKIIVHCIITHSLGHSERVTMEGEPDNSGKKNAIQQVASTVQYLQRYTLLAATGMSTKGTDDDGNGSGGEAPTDDSEDAILDAFQDAALGGTASLRKHYDEHTPTEAFWAKHNRALKQAAAKADAEAKKGGAR